MSRFDPPLIHPSRNGLPVLLSVPHAGRHYDGETLARSTQGKLALQALEDPLVDRLGWRAVADGFGAVVQTVPRAVIDCNRREEEVDPAAIRDISPQPVGPKARHGLGIIPSRTHRHGRLWREPINRGEFLTRLDEIYRPYHRAIEVGMDELSARFGEALLIDCHSMPRRPAGQPKIVIGDRHGLTCAPWIMARAVAITRQHGYSVALNDPYAGGAIVERHGRPANGRHAIQLEIDRSLYLDGAMRPAASFDHVAQLIAELAIGLGQDLVERDRRMAAE